MTKLWQVHIVREGKINWRSFEKFIVILNIIFEDISLIAVEILLLKWLTTYTKLSLYKEYLLRKSTSCWLIAAAALQRCFTAYHGYKIIFERKKNNM